MEIPSDEILLANVTSFLIEGQEFYEASILLDCAIETSVYDSFNECTSLIVEIIGIRAIYEIIKNKDHPATVTIKNAFNAVLPADVYVEVLRPRIELAKFDDNWRSKLLDLIEVKEAINQGIPIQNRSTFEWEGLRFRSPVEISVAKALDKFNVFFLPNCMGRLGYPGKREIREADFLVCFDGKWGILEVNGVTYHTDAEKDQERARLFKSHGIRVFEPYMAKRCISDPEGVVRGFLEILKKNG